MEGKDIKQVNKCVYLGRNISESGRVNVAVRRRIQAGANAWRKVEGVMVAIQISRKLKVKVLDFGVVPASTLWVGDVSSIRNYKHVRTTG